MIHDALLMLWDASGVNFRGNTFEKSISSLNPADKELFCRICETAKSHRRVQNFIEDYSFRSGSRILSTKQLHGLYTQALSEAMDEILTPYRHAVRELESKVLENSKLTLSFIYAEIEQHRSLLNTLNRIISVINEKQIHGCQILSIVYQHILCGNEVTRLAILKLFTIVMAVFYNQLCSWLLYGELKDPYNEFIIHKVDKSSNASKETILSSPSTYDKTLNTINDSSLDCGYAINVHLIPYFLPLSLVQEIAFIGKTVVLFGFDPRSVGKRSIAYTNFVPFHNSSSRRFTIWDEKEAMFHEKIKELKASETIDINKFTIVLKEIKACVTQHLWLVTVQEAQLLKELRLVKDFFLLGRGELFLELLRLTEQMLNDPPTPVSTRDMNQAFHLAARSVFLSNSSDIEKFSFELPYVKSNSFLGSDGLSDGWSSIILKYNFKWPLHLIFTPEVLARYNDMFRLLLRIKKTQHNLHLLWKTYKLTHGTSVWQLHNKLMFLMDNLQHYLQADVLETNFSKLMNTIDKLNDFEQLKKAHATFLTDILSQSFLFMAPSCEESDSSVDGVDTLSNPVLCNMLELLQLSDATCNMARGSCNPPEEEYHILGYNQRFESLVGRLLQLLTALRSQPCGTYLARFLMRLDYNRWFSQAAHLTQSVTSILNQ